MSDEKETSTLEVRPAIGELSHLDKVNVFTPSIEDIKEVYKNSEPTKKTSEILSILFSYFLTIDNVEKAIVSFKDALGITASDGMKVDFDSKDAESELKFAASLHYVRAMMEAMEVKQDYIDLAIRIRILRKAGFGDTKERLLAELLKTSKESHRVIKDLPDNMNNKKLDALLAELTKEVSVLKKGHKE